MEVKLIATDLDGTLFSGGKAEITKRTQSALQAAADKGITLVIASGRTFDVFPECIQSLEMIKYAVVSNGAVIIDFHTKEVLYERLIEFEYWVKIYRFLKEKKTVFQIYCKTHSYVEHEMLEYCENETSKNICIAHAKDSIVVDNILDLLDGEAIEKFFVGYVPDETRATLASDLAKIAPSKLTASVSGTVEINQRDANKGNALDFLCREIGIAPHQTVVFGDGDNDVEMLSFSPNSYCMANACKEAKEAAAHETLSNDDEGVAVIIEKIVANEGGSPEC